MVVESEVSRWAFVDTLSVAVDDAWAGVPTSGVVQISSSWASDTVGRGSQTFGTSEVANLADSILREGSFSAFLDTFLIGSGDLKVSFSWFTAGTGAWVVDTGLAWLVAGSTLVSVLVGDST